MTQVADTEISAESYSGADAMRIDTAKAAAVDELHRLSEQLSAKNTELRQAKAELYGVLEDVREAFFAEDAVTHVLAGATDLSDAAYPLLEAVGAAFEFDFATYWSCDSVDGELIAIAHWQRDQSETYRLVDAVSALRLTSGEGIVRTAFLECHEMICEDPDVLVREPLAAVLASYGLNTICAFPITNGGASLGVIEMGRCKRLGPDHAIEPAMRVIGDRVAAFIEFSELQKRYIAIVGILEGKIEDSIDDGRSADRLIPVPRLRRAA